MSGPSAALAVSNDPLCDDGVLQGIRTLEWHGWNAARLTGGAAVLPWRAQHRALERGGGCERYALPPTHAAWPQVAVRITKGAAGVLRDCADAVRVLQPGGRLLLCGSNELGIGSWQRSAAAWGAVEVLVIRAHQRVLAIRNPSLAPPPALPAVPLLPQHAEPTLLPQPGLFSHDGLDRGTQLLIDVVLAAPPVAQVLDVGCGIGHLGLACAHAWPQVQVAMLDADQRAVRAAEHNAERLSLSSRVSVAWCDDQDPWPVDGVDLVLCNPPAHAGAAHDRSAANALMIRAHAALRRGGRVLIVANRQLPYERVLAACGRTQVLREDAGFKVLECRRD